MEEMSEAGGVAVLRDEALCEEIHHSVVGGMNVFVLPKRGFKRKYAEILVHYGSNDNAFALPGGKTVEVPPGIAHFLEHKMFEKSWGEAFQEFAKLGASANAYTANNYTSYLFWTLDNFAEALRMVFRVALEPYFTAESVAKEQDIIGQEIRMYNDEPGSRLSREVLEALYREHPVRIDIAGTEHSIRLIDKDLLYLCHSAFYRPSNMALFVAGDVVPGEVYDLADRYLALYSVPSDGGCIRRIRPDEPPDVGANSEVNLPVPVPLVEVAWKGDAPGENGARLLKSEIATSLLLDILFGRSSSFFTEAYEEGLLDEVSASHESWPDYSYSAVAAQSVSPEKLIDRIYGEIERARHEGVSEDDFARVKRASIGRYVTVFDSFDTAGEMQAHLHDIGLDIFTYGRMLRAVSVSDVQDRIGAFQRERAVSVIVRDKKLGQRGNSNGRGD
jgi:predicted Zn-dependent peptidase